MNNIFKVPGDIQHATDSLNSIGMLITASEWQRSAIVRAFVRKSNGRPSKAMESHGFTTIDGFVRLGIVGLRDINTVRRYYDAWDLTGLPIPVPGESITIPGPELEFPAVKNNPAPQPAGNSGRPESGPAHQPFRGNGAYNSGSPDPDPVPPHDLHAEADRFRQLHPQPTPPPYDPDQDIREWFGTVGRSLDYLENVVTPVSRAAVEELIAELEEKIAKIKVKAGIK